MSDLAETFQNDISQIFNERGLLRTELIAKEKLLTDAILQKNALNQSLKQLRNERDELFVNNQKLRQEKLAAEAEKSASTIHVTILKEEKNLLEKKLYQLTQHYEESRLQIDELNRQNLIFQNQKQNQYIIPIQQTNDHHHEIDDLKKRIIELEESRENLIERHKHELQLSKNESNKKDEEINSLQQLISQYERKIEINDKNKKELEQRIQDVTQTCRSQIPDKSTALARGKKACIIFFDEVDAIGGARFDDGAGGDNEVQRTMLELINQLDGFDPRGNIKVLMATNRPDTLDPALVRPGRLDRKVEFNLPDLEGRTHIFKIHTKSMSVEKDIRYELLARLCPNSTGAELRSVCTEAGMFAIRARRKIATEKDFIEAVNKVIKAYAKFSSTPRYMTYN
ncbi:unnamed protein product [Rotaria sp. Silwood1]|nr:unnamed protein product [Rotaria sp. Silwood1]